MHFFVKYFAYILLYYRYSRNEQVNLKNTSRLYEIPGGYRGRLYIFTNKADAVDAKAIKHQIYSFRVLRFPITLNPTMKSTKK